MNVQLKATVKYCVLCGESDGFAMVGCFLGIVIRFVPRFSQALYSRAVPAGSVDGSAVRVTDPRSAPSPPTEPISGGGGQEPWWRVLCIVMIAPAPAKGPARQRLIVQ